MSAVTQMTVGKVNSVHPRFSMNEQKYRLQGFFLACCTWADPRMLLFEGVNGVVTVWLQSMRRRGAGRAGPGSLWSCPACTLWRAAQASWNVNGKTNRRSMALHGLVPPNVPLSKTQQVRRVQTHLRWLQGNVQCSSVKQLSERRVSRWIAIKIGRRH